MSVRTAMKNCGSPRSGVRNQPFGWQKGSSPSEICANGDWVPLSYSFIFSTLTDERNIAPVCWREPLQDFPLAEVARLKRISSSLSPFPLFMIISHYDDVVDQPLPGMQRHCSRCRELSGSRSSNSVIWTGESIG